MGKKAGKNQKAEEGKKPPKHTGKREPPGADPSGELTGKKPPAAKARAGKGKKEPGAEGGGNGNDSGGDGGNSESSWDLSDED